MRVVVVLRPSSSFIGTPESKTRSGDSKDEAVTETYSALAVAAAWLHKQASTLNSTKHFSRFRLSDFDGILRACQTHPVTKFKKTFSPP